MADDECKECGQPLIEVENRGRHLRGCLSCNGWRDDEGNFVKLSVEDLAALHELRGTDRSPSVASTPGLLGLQANGQASLGAVYGEGNRAGHQVNPERAHQFLDRVTQRGRRAGRLQKKP
jgi:hypothetical protein